MQHYFLNRTLTPGDQIGLPAEISHHLDRVLRSQVGDEVELVSSQQVVFKAQIDRIADRTVFVSIIEKLAVNVELPVSVTVVSGLSKRNKPELIVQKATEMGASKLIFVPMAWSVVKWAQKSDKKIKRLQEVALSAAEQSHRNVVPTVQYLDNLAALFNDPFDLKLVAYEESAKAGEAANLVKLVAGSQPGASIVAVFGPEGGISPTEIDQLSQNGFIPMGLGPRIMRTETAPLYFLAACSVLTELAGKLNKPANHDKI
ncbi:ribosomal RNA small subunit methyltransferase E [Lentilactobacillus fungorum]|uniref:Ribosomal RNA small subunit methyltransferase E n=1 Tax=Lentilactobacillus fungorum TaxID=2201250 RepID=A0ABQ3VW93_9LACO|nr:16S rRNA (uracil(1498)-N(3))-methyltransferase [Lentilactobacillus fungorum]GHP12711.1 ribosomal RNA small subunit methyltransferase E [Lentilactobacillus fungorum]